MIFHEGENGPIVAAGQKPATAIPNTNGKIAAVNPTLIGSSSNSFSILRQEQNQVFVNNDLDVVGFIHRNDATVYGGSSGNLNYGLSIDNGATFTKDIGFMNPLLTFVARYPNGTLYNPPGNTNPLSAKVVAYAPTLATGASFDGHFNCVANVELTTNGLTAPTEHYDHTGEGTLLPGGLTEGLPGEFWAVDAPWDGTNSLGPITIYKGIYSGGDIIYTQQPDLVPSHDLSVDGTPTMIGPNMAFSPDGTVGFIAMIGDLIGGPDSVLSPIFSKTTDNGVTWTTPIEMDLNSVAWIADSLTSFWEDSLGNPASNGVATCAFDFDFTVDKNGNPHMAVVIGSQAVGTPYSISSGLEKFMADIWSPDGGATWTARYVSPVLCFRTPAFGATATTITMDNSTQLARSEDGSMLFFAWADSDTALVGGNQNGVGFGESTNSAPNLRVAAVAVDVAGQSYPMMVTDGDPSWQGRALFPTMAPEVITLPGNCYKLPIVMGEMPASEPIDPTNWWYFGNDVTICATDLCNPATMTLAWDQFYTAASNPPCTPVAVGVKDVVASSVVLGNAYPNPTTNSAMIAFELPATATVSMELVNMFGQQVAVLANGEYTAGAHKVTVNTEKLAAGVYFYSLRTNDQVLSNRLVVSK